MLPIQDPHSRNRPAFTLVELLMVIAIIGILMALLFPAVNAMRASSQATACRGNLRQLGMGVIAYSQDRDGYLPAQWRTSRPNAWDNFSWVVEVLPYIDQQTVRDALKLQETPLSPGNRQVVAISIPILECPATPGSPRKIHTLGTDESQFEQITIGARDYVAIHSVTGPDGGSVLAGIWSGGADLSSFPSSAAPEFDSAMDNREQFTFDPHVRTIRSVFSDARDGLSNTALLIEQAGKPDHYRQRELVNDGLPTEGAWATAEINAFTAEGVNADNFTDPHGFHGAVSVIMADGSVHSWDESMDRAILRALLSRSGSEIISADDWR
jgi:prepilin-type N-terminal cleavage/methylation domain-containing protein